MSPRIQVRLWSVLLALWIIVFLVEPGWIPGIWCLGCLIQIVYNAAIQVPDIEEK